MPFFTGMQERSTANVHDYQEILWTGSNISIWSAKRIWVSSHFLSHTLLLCLLSCATRALLLSKSLKWTACSQAVMIFTFVRDSCLVIIMAQSIPSIPIPQKHLSSVGISFGSQHLSKSRQNYSNCRLSNGCANVPIVCQVTKMNLSRVSSILVKFLSTKLSLGRLYCSQTRQFQPSSKLKSIPVLFLYV